MFLVWNLSLFLAFVLLVSCLILFLGSGSFGCGKWQKNGVDAIFRHEHHLLLLLCCVDPVALPEGTFWGVFFCCADCRRSHTLSLFV